MRTKRTVKLNRAAADVARRRAGVLLIPVDKYVDEAVLAYVPDHEAVAPPRRRRSR